MKGIVNFLIEACKLKELPRTGLVTWRVKNPATVADHIFRAAFTFWLLGAKRGINTERALKFALFHDLCEVYAGDLTPLIYYTRRTKRIMKGIRLSAAEKARRANRKFQIEKKALVKLLKFLPSQLSKEVFGYWLNFEKGSSGEVKLIREFDRLDSFLESFEYIGKDRKVTGTAWWEIVEEAVEDLLMVEFLYVVQKRFYGSAPHSHKGAEGGGNEEELKNILDFLLKIGELKKMPRLYWRLRGIKNPETVAGHIYTLALAAWALVPAERHFNMEKLLKMAFCHELSVVYTGDTTPYDRILPGGDKERKEILKRMVRLSKKEKENIFIEDYKDERRSLEKLTSKLNPKLKKEILTLWHEYRTKSSKEARFLSQLNTAVILLQGLLYEKKYKSFSAAPIWEWVFEVTDDPLVLEFLEALKKKFHSECS